MPEFTTEEFLNTQNQVEIWFVFTTLLLLTTIKMQIFMWIGKDQMELDIVFYAKKRIHLLKLLIGQLFKAPRSKGISQTFELLNVCLEVRDTVSWLLI